jgi:transposase InsO family protein
VNVYPFIEAERVTGAGCVRRACRLLKVSRAAYYAWSSGAPRARRLADEELLARIAAAHKASRGTYGSPRITRALRQGGLRVSRKRVARLMAQRGLAGRARRRAKRTTIADPAAKGRATDLLRRNFAPQNHAIDTLWCGDISYVRTWEGWAYVATVIDLSSRRVVGLAMADHLRASLATEALEMALAQRRPEPGLVFHSVSCQYTSAEFRGLLGHRGLVQSLSRPGQCWDNAVAESFFATLKEELLYRGAWPTRVAARRAIFEYVEVFYNRQRMHSTLGYLTPVAYEARLRECKARETQAA